MVVKRASVYLKGTAVRGMLVRVADAVVVVVVAIWETQRHLYLSGSGKALNT